MPRTEWHEETWDEAISVLREHFTQAGFEVHVNPRVRTVTIISRPKALAIMDVTGAHFNGDNKLVFKDD